MATMLDWHERLADRTLTVARVTQAVAVDALDRAARLGRGGLAYRALLPVESLLDVTARCVGEPADVIDGAYNLVERLVELHHEFAHRMLDAVDDRVRMTMGPDGTGRSVIVPDGHRVLRFPVDRIGLSRRSGQS